MTGATLGRADRFRAVDKVVAYLRLAKLRVYQHGYPWLLVVLLLHKDHVSRHGMTAALGLVLVAMIMIKSATCAADDIVGYRDGSDARNYASGGHLPPASKPLLTGALTEREAIMFGLVTGALAALAGLGVVIVLGGDVPLAVVVGFAAVFAIAVQYSWGVRFSYRPGGLEFVVFTVNAMEVVLPYLLFARKLSGNAVILGALVGVSMLLVVTYANVADRRGDGEAGRRTLVVLTPPRVFAAILVVLTVVSITLAALPFAVGTLRPRWLVLCVVPVIVLRMVQLFDGVGRGRSQQAVEWGFRALDVGGVGMAVAILLSTTG